MADSELADLDAATTLDAADLFYVVRDPAGTPVDRKITVGNSRNPLAAMAAPAVSGRVYRAPFAGSANIGVQTLGRLHARPIWLSAGTLDRIYAQHFDTPTASELCRLGIYSDTDNRPGALVLDAGTIDLSTAVGVKSKTISQAIPTGRYWLASARQGPTNSANMITFTLNTSLGALEEGGGWVEIRPDATAVHDRCGAGVYVDSVSGALPDPFGTATWNDSEAFPVIAVRYA